ncbi:helix-turn-helix transcriptional regulator [Terriglobus aquaticus]|uniref:Helix-turn-helix transcriptional regulator n=1 Tax=Terriglobus aquaticus TaxID=940139 RepID=A0ABW9KI66_9BACT
MEQRYIRLPRVQELYAPVSKPTIYRWIAEGRFPRPHKLPGGRAVAWLESEVVACLQGEAA